MKRRYRVLIAKPGLDGHDRGAHVVARGLLDAGFEVILTGLFQTPAAIVAAATDEDVDAVGLSILSGAHNVLLPRVVQGLRRHRPGILVVAGGVIPAGDIPGLLEAGVDGVFTHGTPLSEITGWLEGALDARESP